MSTQAPTAEPQLNATPLIDVLLVLLVMLIFTLPIATHAVKLNLPQGPAGAPSPSITLNIDFDGQLVWDGSPIDGLRALAPKLASIGAAVNPPRINVVPDKRVKYETVAKVLAAAQRAHVRALNVAPVID